MKYVWVLLLALVASVGPAAAQPDPGWPSVPATPQAWRDAAREDILASYEIFVENHPGMYDPENPGFHAQLAGARDSALALADRASDFRSSMRALNAFTARLADGHAAVIWTGTMSRSSVWPGFIVAWRGDRLLVFYAEQGAPVPVGTQIVSCDGRSAHDIVAADMEALHRPAEPGQFWLAAPWTFLVPDFQSPFRLCLFRLSDGREQDLPLAWSPVTRETRTAIYARAGDAAEGERTEIGLTEPRPGVFLIGLPSYSPGADGERAYHRLLDTIRERRAELNIARAIVLDQRHNNGGSSAWSQLLAEALWGKPAVDAAMSRYFRDTRIWWRASEDNAAHLRRIVSNIRARGHIEMANLYERHADGIADAHARGDLYYVEPRVSAPADADAVFDFATPVYVITGGGCVSACLDALDTFTRFANTKLIGAPTSADSTYMEVRYMPLPSGRGRLVIPNKVWINRPRRPGEVYQPHIPMNDLDWSTGNFLDRIERDVTDAGSPQDR